MKSTGIIRRVDELGRVVIPRETRRTLSIEEKDPLEIFIDGDQIILRKYLVGCELCGTVEIAVEKDGHHFCRECIEHMASQLSSENEQKKAAQ